MTTQLNLPFIKNDWTISLSDIPSYAEFKGEFIEPLDYHILQMFMETTNPNITTLMKQEIQDKLINKINTKSGHLSVYHHQANGLGRFYPNDNVSLIPFSKYIKHTIFKYLGWRDLDMVKGHMSIALEMGSSVDIEFKYIKRYIESFSEICEETRVFYQLDDDKNALSDDDVKRLFCVMMYGGGLKCWVDALGKGDEKKGYKPRQVKNGDKYSPFAQMFKTETKTIIDRIYTKNPSLVRKLKKPDEEQFKTKGSVSSYWFQTIENHILHIVYCHLVEQKLIKPKWCGLEYDGLCLPPFLKQTDETKLIDDINTIIRLKTGLNIKMKFKDYSPSFVLDEIIEQRHTIMPLVANEQIVGDDAEDIDISGEFIPEDSHPSYVDAIKKYHKWKIEFEKEWCKIVNNSVYIRRYVNESGSYRFIYMTEAQLITSKREVGAKYYVMYPMTGLKQVTLCFIKKWIDDPKMRVFDEIVNKPPPLVSKTNQLNVWVDSPFETQQIIHSSPDFHAAAVEMFSQHIDSLCNFEPLLSSYVKDWVAHSIQRPAEKVGVAINMVSAEGVGKNIFADTLGELYGGSSKILTTAKPEQDVWGSFGDLMVGAYLVVLNEVDKRNCKGSDGRIKSLITDKVLSVNPKGKTQIMIESYHRFLGFSNFDDSTNTSNDDRRNTIARCSDINKGNMEYFQKLVDVLKEPNALRSIYWDFKLRDISKFRIGVAFKTEYHKIINEHTVDPLREFVKYFVMNNIGIVEHPSYEILRQYKAWSSIHGFKYSESMNSTSLTKSIKLKLRMPDEAFYSKHTREGGLLVFDSDKIIKFLNLTSLMDEGETDTETIQSKT